MIDRAGLEALREAVSAAGTDAARVEAAALAEAEALAALPSQLDAGVPCLLLPVRLETRFHTDPNSTLLRVRVYPDEIHLDQHERGLTDEEVALGTAYWRALFETPGSPVPTPTQRVAAWEQVARRLGPARGAYVTAALTPRSAPPDPLDLPPVPGAAASWTRPPLALAMPERWRVRAWRDGVLAAETDGALIPQPMPAGPGPQGIDADTDWMSDFRRAVKVGMGVELDVGARRVDVLTVVGVRGTDTPAQGARLLAQLLHAHHFTSSLDLITPGTPTNNAPERRSDALAHAMPPEVTYQVEREALDVPSATARETTAGTDAAALSAALGLGAAAVGAAPADVASADGPLPDPLATVPAAAAREIATARDLAAVLWPATWGYTAAQMLGRDALARAGRVWVTGTVSPDGPLPTIRIGAQPYGVLPVTSAAAWQPLTPVPDPDPVPGLDTPARRVALLRELRALWRKPLDEGRVPRVHPDPAANSAASLIEVLGADAVSSSVAARGAVGPLLTANLWQILGRELGPVGTGYQSRLRAAVHAQPLVGRLLSRTRLEQVAFESDAQPVKAPLVTEEPDHPEREPLPPDANYLRWAADADPVMLHRGRAEAGGGTGPLLERLVRHATLQAWADAALDARPPDGLAIPLLDPELIDTADLTERDPVTPETLTAWRHLLRASFSADHPRFPDAPVLEVLTTLVAVAEVNGASDPLVADVVAHRAALRNLADAPAGTLRRLLMGTLDVATHRLDAWFTALATDRLRALRAARPAGLQLGGYGIAVDLQARSAPLSQGYTLAPSLAHAATAAVARSGYLAHADDPDGGRLELQLTGRRVRAALTLLDGLAAGQGLPALLGQAFERGLHDLPGNLDVHLSALRAIAPATAGKRIPAPVSGAGAAQARGPLDGLALLRAHQQGTLPWGTVPAGETVPLPASGESRTAIEELLDDLGDQVDAVGDLAVAEAVHQTVLGNPVRAGALLDAVNRGEPVRVDPEVVRSPRSGSGVTHRVLVLLPADAATGSWSTGSAATPRAAADPALEAWAGMILGSPDRIRWRAVFTDAAGVELNADYTLAGLGLGALDLVAFAGAADVTETGGLPLSPTLESLLLAHGAAHPPAGATSAPSLMTGRAAEWDVTVLAVPEALDLARRLGLLLGRARPVRPADLAEPGVDPGTPVDPSLAVRASTATASLGAALTALRNCFAVDDGLRAALAAELPGTDVTGLATTLNLPLTLDPGAITALAAQPADPAAARAALRSLALHGVPGAAPEPVADDAAAALRRQAAHIARVAADRLVAASAASSPADELRAALGEATPALPVFAAPNPAALRLALQARADIGDASPLEVADWLDGAAAVRPALAGLRDLEVIAAACGRDGGLHPAIAQLPAPAAGQADRWAALPLPDPSSGQRAGVVGIALVGPLGASRLADPPTDPLAGPLAGLLVDEWVEVVPARTATSAVTFHVDAPGSSPPQSLLLAVSPDPRSPWTIELLEEVVRDTIDLAQQRLVDPDLTPALGHLLPLLHFARNDGDGGLGDTITTSFTDP